MIKVYLDWNVIAQMKGGYQNELFDILSNKDKFLVPYSTSHIGDIFSSYSEDEEQKRRIDDDLEYITLLTNNYCLSNTRDKVVLDFLDPKSYMQQRIDEKDFMEDFSLDSLDKFISEDESTKGIGKMLISLLKSIPIENSFREAFEHPESGEYLNQMFSGLKENPTMEGFFKCFGKMYHNLNEKEDYKLLREVTQKGLKINRDKIFNEVNPYNIIDNAHNQIGIFLDKYIDNTKHAPEWFNELSNEYIMLDMHGYQEDKVNVKANKRKETFKNTTEDAFHTAFASTCNIYIINDIKSYKKTKQVYDRLNINALVLKPDEFLEHFKKFLNIRELSDHFNTAIELIKTNNFFESKIENGIMRTYIFPYFIFDFFNKIIVLHSQNNEQPTIMLSKFSPTNGNVTYIWEVEKLVKNLNSFFGEDVKKLGDIKKDEFSNKNWDGRVWKLNEVTFRLISVNGYFQLYFDL